MIKLRHNSYFGDPTRARERAERARDRQREREAASNYVEALDHFLAEKVHKGELVKLRSTDLFDLYEIPKDQLRGDTLRAMLELEPSVSTSKGSGMRTTFSRQANIDSAPSSPAEMRTDLKGEVIRDKGSGTEYTRTSCGHNLVTPDEALRLLSNPSTNSFRVHEKRYLPFCVSRTPIPHISAWWNNMLMHNSQSLSVPVD
jgi:hypothetical protein